MTRYYFFQADLYEPDGNPSGVDRLLGSNHGIYAVEDAATPDVVFEEIIKGLTDDATVQYEANAKLAGAEAGPAGMYYVMKQFNRVD